MLVYDFHSVIVRVYPKFLIVETEFRDGALLVATPEHTDAYSNVARKLGYGTNTWALCRDHELTHTLIAIAAGLDWCPVLHDVAHHEHTLSDEAVWDIENTVYASQRELAAKRG